MKTAGERTCSKLIFDQEVEILCQPSLCLFLHGTIITLRTPLLKCADSRPKVINISLLNFKDIICGMLSHQYTN